MSESKPNTFQAAVLLMDACRVALSKPPRTPPLIDIDPEDLCQHCRSAEATECLEAGAADPDTGYRDDDIQVCRACAQELRPKGDPDWWDEDEEMKRMYGGVQ